MKLNIVFENEDFVAISKPSGMLSVPDRKQSEPSLKDFLKQKYGGIFTVHRLDKFTSGLILFAKNSETHKQLSQLFESRAIEKFYVGIVNGALRPSSGTVNTPIMEHPAKDGRMLAHSKGKPSETDYETIEIFKNYSLVQFQIHTGRTHQIRIHTQYLGQSIVCDELYGDGRGIYLSAIKKKYNLSKNQWEERPIMGRLALHSHRMTFALNGETYSLEAALPKDFTATLEQLRKNN